MSRYPYASRPAATCDVLALMQALEAGVKGSKLFGSALRRLVQKVVVEIDIHA